ncbi:hypothetical protein JQC91_16910 [Jannaschia sp. Os4]|uniref:hypothetical protein n=1 Tax=Jannaschia sp. Os4 TaxID=2807617 RepID=UPI00193A8F0C|nr:hypothetical protein [Jannaschia sp. Os4]MBM2577988.1 hypothetical protein [Jannaschia sp. Os4]
MSRHLASLCWHWLSRIEAGVILSTALCLALLAFDVRGFASVTTALDGGALVRATVWALLILPLAAAWGATDRMTRTR